MTLDPGPRIGSLCSGYGGLDMALQAAVGGSTAWHAEIAAAPAAVLAHRWPDTPNLGDFTAVDWSDVPEIDALAAGFPCQPVSVVGRRLGDRDERWLWDDVARAIDALRPRLVLLENVRGLVTAGGGRLFGRVLADLARLGFDARWVCLTAAGAAGAAHLRPRIFLVAADPDRQPLRLVAGGLVGDETGQRRAGPAHHRVAGGGAPLARRWPSTPALDRIAAAVGPSLDRWARVVGRPAPVPLDADNRLSAPFSEWLMGLPAGHVTDVPGLAYSAQHKALGNGVVPQAGTAAVRHLYPALIHHLEKSA